MNNIVDLYREFNRMAPPKGTILNEGKKLSPNDKCPCGSDRKYKKCCKQRLEEYIRLKKSNQITAQEINNIIGR